jgi:DNA-binding NtrC family response regulator
MARILHVDDDPILQALTARILERSGHEVRSAGDLPAAWGQLTAFGPDLVLLDVDLPGGSGLDLLAGIVTSGASVVVVSGFGQVEGPQVDLVGDDMTMLAKPFAPDQLREAVERSLAQRRRRRHRQETG